MAAERLFSAFRKPPQVDELTDADKVGIAVYGALDWIRAHQARDWDAIADKAVGLFLAGYPVKSIHKFLDVEEEEFERHVDVAKIKAFIQGEIARGIYSMALAGDEKMMKLVAETRMDWHKSKEVNQNVSVNGSIAIQPVLNLQLLSKEEESKLRRGGAIDVADYEVKKVTDGK